MTDRAARRARSAAIHVGTVGALLLSVGLSIGCAGASPELGAQRLGRHVPDLAVFDLDGSEQQLTEHLGGATLLHVFASWCAACRWELPALMRLEAEAGIPVIALSTDPSFGRVRALFGGRPPANVFRVEERDVRRELGVSSLPQTFVLDARGNLRLRFVGARDWSDEALRDLVRRELGLER